MLKITKEGNKNFFYECEPFQPYTASDLVISFNGNTGFLTSVSGRPIFLREGWNYTDISVNNETFSSVEVLAQKLVDLGCPAYYTDGDVVITSLVSTDAGNSLVIGTDGLLFASASGGSSVDSVNGQVGTVFLTADDIPAGSTNQITSIADINQISANLSEIEQNTDAIDDLESGKADKTNVLEKDNTTAYTPTLDYHPATLKYVNDNAGGTNIVHKQTADQTLVFLSGSNQSLYKFEIPANTFSEGDDIRVKAITKKESASNNGGYVTKILISNSDVDNIGTAITLASVSTSTSNRKAGYLNRTLIVKDGYTEVLSIGVNAGYDFSVINPLGLSQYVIDWTEKRYIYVACTGNTSDQAQCVYFKLTKN